MGSDDFPFDAPSAQPELEVEQDEFFAQCYKWLYQADPDGNRLSDRGRTLYGWILVRYKGYEVKGRAMFPCKQTLADELGWSPSTVKRGLADLREWNEILTSRHRGFGQSDVISLYNKSKAPWDKS